MQGFQDRHDRVAGTPAGRTKTVGPVIGQIVLCIEYGNCWRSQWHIEHGAADVLSGSDQLVWLQSTLIRQWSTNDNMIGLEKVGLLLQRSQMRSGVAQTIAGRIKNVNDGRPPGSRGRQYSREAWGVGWQVR